MNKTAIFYDGNHKNNFLPALKNWKEGRIVKIIGNLPGITAFMPPFIGNEKEKASLAKWIASRHHQEDPPPGEITGEENVGQKFFEENCSLCHELFGSGGILPSMAKYRTIVEITNLLGRLEEITEDMPPFEGTVAEKTALAEYLFELKEKKNKDE